MTALQFAVVAFLLHDIRRRIVAQPGDRVVSVVCTCALVGTGVWEAIGAVLG